MSHKVKAACGRLSYAKCMELIGDEQVGDCIILAKRSTKRIAANTWLSRYADKVAYHLDLHGKTILEWHPGGIVVLSSCGYRTVTTKARLNQFGPVPISQMKYEWYAGSGLFHDGMIVFEDGVFLDAIVASTPLHKDTYLAIIADWLEEHNRPDDAARVRAVVAAGLEPS